MVYIDEHIDDFDLQAALAELSEQRRQQALRFRFEHGQRTCALAYLLLRRALREEFGIDEQPLFDYGEHGKPVLVSHPDIHFNLSHCREAVACVVSRRPVGIDVESVSHYKESVARYTMSQQEMDQILHADRHDVMFTRLWTMKEAVLKLSGEGLRDNLKEVLANVDNLNIQTVVSEDERYVYSEAREKE
jgi:4'-phosphopantetheinyl transferase